MTLFLHKLKYQMAPSVVLKMADAVTSCGQCVSVSSFSTRTDNDLHDPDGLIKPRILN